jgi:hypothetical protein
MHYEFRKDLKDGESAEDEVAILLRPYLEEDGCYMLMEDKAKKTHDLRYVHNAEPDFLVEVKWDQYSKKSDNIAFEFECSGKPSGIATTGARLWVYKYWEDDWAYRAIETKRLKEYLCLDGSQIKFRIVKGGDEHRARMVLVPKDVFRTWGVKL